MNEERSRVKELFLKWESANENEREKIIDELGRRLTVEHYHLFADILAESIKTGILTVTGWTREAVKAALIVCSENNLSMTFKNGERTVAPVSYPKEGPMLEMFVNAIMTGEWG